MSPNRFDDLAQRWVPGEGPVEVRPLADGLVNRSWRVVRAGRAYSMRMAAADGRELGLDRRWECAVRARAGAAGLAPSLCRCDPARGVLIADWAAGRAWSAAEICLPGNIEVMAQLLQRVHALEIPQPARRMDPGDWIDLYQSALASREPAAASGGGPLRSVLLHNAGDAHLARLALQPASAPVLCHGDLHRLNVLIGAAPLLLDWEYAHVSDRLWDLAGWVANNDFSRDTAERLLSAYLRRPARASELERLATWVWLYDYICLLWSELHLNPQRAEPNPEIAARAAFLATRLTRPGW